MSHPHDAPASYERTFWQEIADLPHELSFVQVGPWRTRVLTAGTGARTVVLLAGTSGHIEAFGRNIAALAAEYRVVAYDFPGHGFTTHATDDLEIEDYSVHLLGLLDALELPQATIFGESLGGWVAIRFAGDHPERVDKLVLSSPGGNMLPTERLTFLRDLNERVAENPTWDDVRTRLEVVMYRPESVTDEMVAVRQDIYALEGFARSMHHIMCLHDPEIRFRNRLRDEDFARIQAPTLLVWTGHEPAGPEELGRSMAAKIPAGEFFMINDAAHWPQWEDAPAFNERMLSFLGGTR